MKKILFLNIVLVFLSCDKDNRSSKQLMKVGSWEVVELSVDGVNESILPSWHFRRCYIYDNVCEATWKTSDTTKSQFYWQFNDEAETFTISRVVAPEDCEEYLTEEVEQQTFRFSGVYDVTENERKSKAFESYHTEGHEGQKVVIRVQKIEED